MDEREEEAATSSRMSELAQIRLRVMRKSGGEGIGNLVHPREDESEGTPAVLDGELRLVTFVSVCAEETEGALNPASRVARVSPTTVHSPVKRAICTRLLHRYRFHATMRDSGWPNRPAPIAGPRYHCRLAALSTIDSLILDENYSGRAGM